METEEKKRILIKAIKERNVGFLCEYYFNVELTPKQIDIVRKIVWPENNRIVISCMTRYGKSFVVSMAILLYIAFHSNKRNLIIAPTIDQSRIIRNYISDFIINSEEFKEIVDIALTGLDRLKSEVSKKRITFKNGSELQILSAEGSAERLMGFGANGILVCVPGDTLIYTDYGFLRIDDIVMNKIGCRVLSFNHNNGYLEFKDILDYQENGVKTLLRFEYDYGHIDCTDDHPVYVIGKGYIPASKVNLGDRVMGFGKDLNMFNVSKYNDDNLMRDLPRKNKLQTFLLEEYTIKKISRKKSKKVYNLNIKDNHNYFCNGVLTHNCDESCLIDFEVFRSKISRMLGDSPEAILVEIGNPWHRNNQMYEHWINPKFEHIHIGWKTALEEKRIDTVHLEEQRKLLTAMEFKVLYEAEFPEESEDSIFTYKCVQEAIDKEFEWKNDR